MNYILDTNIIMYSQTRKGFDAAFDKKFRSRPNKFIISVVTEGELQSLALQRNWGKNKLLQLRETLSKYIIHPIKVQSIISAYAQIDAYSQGKLADQPLPYRMTSRNMGKNDLWIAATAYATGATLITTDLDFEHLDNVFLNLERIDIQSFS